MPNSVSSVSQTQFAQAVQRALQQNDSRLTPSVQHFGGVRGGEFKVPKLAKISTSTLTSGNDLTYAEGVNSFATVTLTDDYAVDFIADQDANEVTPQLAAAYVKNVVGAINRRRDAKIIAAMDASHTNSTATGNASWSNLLIATRLLNAEDADFDGRTFVAGPWQIANLQDDTKIISADYAGAMSSVMNGAMATVLGIKFVMSNLLTVNAGSPTTTSCFLYNKQGVALATKQNPAVRVERIPQKDGDQIMARDGSGAVTVYSTAVVELILDND